MRAPRVTVSEGALRAFREAAHQMSEGDVLRLSIDAKFHNDLFFAPVEPKDVVVVVDGLRIAMNPRTAQRADGLHIDYVEGPSATGFKLDNPNASSRIQGVRPVEVVRMLEAGESFEFIDARPAAERAKVSIVMARALDEVYAAELEAAPRERKLVLLGHHSTDGRTAARPFEQKGFKEVWYVVGGIDAWSTMDPSVPRY
ncbi:MAG: hypothetical protein GX607_10445 [Myxococcales bacterium]|nr:hypothetical protein [Myxococcales bacterium]